MHKEELITLHQMMVEIKDFFERINPELKFSQYYALKIDPTQVHRSKMEHKYAIFILGTELANAMRDVEFGASCRISARMRELAEKTLKEIENMKYSQYHIFSPNPFRKQSILISDAPGGGRVHQNPPGRTPPDGGLLQVGFSRLGHDYPSRHSCLLATTSLDSDFLRISSS